MATRALISGDHVSSVLNPHLLNLQGPGLPVKWILGYPYPQWSDLMAPIQTTKATSVRLQSPLGLGRSLWNPVKKEGSQERVHAHSTSSPAKRCLF